MGNSYLPNDIQNIDTKSLLNFENHSLVQFYHRNLAYFITFYILFLTYFIFNKKISKLYMPISLVLILLLIQIILGIFTLLSDLNIYLSSSHQITSVLLVFSVINLYYSYIK